MKAIKLKTEYLFAPLGIDIVKPRFYWNCQGDKSQTAYQVIAVRGQNIIWDSGKVESDAMTHICYEGEALKSRDMVSWKVRLWDEQGKSGEWSESCFELGLLHEGDWMAKWITGNYNAKKGIRYPVDCFRRQFTLSGEIARARLYASACGVYDLTVNGTRVEEFILAPGVTDYQKRIQYQTYDITGLLSEQNELVLRLADGWYRGSVAAYGVINVFGTETKILAQLEITYMNGNVETIGTDDSFAWSNDGPIRFADLKDGEVYDASLKPTYSGKAKITQEAIVPTASNNVPVREKERFTPVLLTTPSGKKVLDFGQNLAGYLEFTIQGRKGDSVRLTCGEILDKTGELNLTGIQEHRPAKGWNQLRLIKKLLGKPIKGHTEPTPKQEILLYLSGACDHYKTSFAVFGFRYVQIETEASFDAEDFRAIAVYSDMEETGSFECSNKMVNQLYHNTVWSMKGNFLDIPTDCPTRERLGWTGDAQIFFHTGAYLMDTASFFRKWLKDMEDGQYANGLISAVIPFQGVEMMYKSTGTSVGWADAIYLIPYRYYQRFGDMELLRDCYPMMKKYTNYLMTHLGMSDKNAGRANPYNQYTYEKGIHLGEWLEPEEFRDRVYGMQAKHPEECTAYLYYTMRCMADIAHLIGRQEEAAEYLSYANGAKTAYNELFVKTGSLNTDRQAKIVRPLALGLLEGEEEKKAQELLIQAVEKYRFRVGTGFLSTPFLLPELTRGGHAETAYRMLLNTEKPGWLAEVKAGATTIWENWEGDLSQNHYSPGAVCEWLFDTVGGIKVDAPNHVTIAPVPGGMLTYAKTCYDSLYGKVESSWRIEAETYYFKIVIPPNVTGDIRLPNGEQYTVGCGMYEYQN